MEWYYADGNNPVGPVSESDFNNLVSVGKITRQTRVWNSTMPEWLPYGQLQSGGGAVSPPPIQFHTAPCAVCGHYLSEQEMTFLDGRWVCESCKPAYFRSRHDFHATGLPYAGFWIRFGAIMIDGLIFFALQRVAAIGLVILFAESLGGDELAIASQAGVYLVNLTVGLIVFPWMVSRYGATPGKMACGLKIVRPDGGPIGIGRAIARQLAENLSLFIFCIGYIMAVFDDEKRTLHDRICDTRVIHKEK